MATQLRPTTRYQPPDWFTSNYTISTNAERQRDASHQVRQEGRFLRNETDNQTKWDQHSNNVRLADRVDNIRKWKEILEKTLADTDREIADLTESKEQTEQALEAKNLPLDVAIECLTLREGRQAIDVVQDEPEAQLHKVKTYTNDFNTVLLWSWGYILVYITVLIGNLVMHYMHWDTSLVHQYFGELISLNILFPKCGPQIFKIFKVFEKLHLERIPILPVNHYCLSYHVALGTFMIPTSR